MARWDAGPAALVLLGMALFVAAVYVAVVLGGGVLVGRTDSPSLVLSVVATAIVAVGFQPVRRRLRPIAARLARGERAAPYEALTRFLAGVADGHADNDVPVRMARLLAEATGARYAQVWLSVGGTPVPAATWPPGAASDEPPPDLAGAVGLGGRRVLPVRYADDLLGVLVIGERDRQPLTPVEEQLFADLAAQAGLALRSVRLRTELDLRLQEASRRAQQLRASRQRIIAAQDTERRRLERDIHDGAQQHLVALAVNLRLARTLAARSPERAPAVLAEVSSAAADTVSTLSDLSHGIYPRLLSQRGLAAALQAAVAAGPVPAVLTVEEMDRPRHDVESALYFCCLEALQNAAKHSGATRVDVRLRQLAEDVVLTVSDDGTGFSPAPVGPGSGLGNMRDRADSLGGSLSVQSQAGQGTVIAVRIPLAAVTQGGA